MIKLKVQLVITDRSGKESVPVCLTASRYSPVLLERLVNDCLTKSLEKLGMSKLESVRPLSPEISICLTGASGQKVRPSVHLESATLDRLTAAGASFDFDPY